MGKWVGRSKWPKKIGNHMWMAPNGACRGPLLGFAAFTNWPTLGTMVTAVGLDMADRRKWNDFQILRYLVSLSDC